MSTIITQNVHRKEAWEKVTGKAVYTDDLPVTKYLTARLLTSPHPHARIKGIDTRMAEQVEGVKAVVTGEDYEILAGPLLEDRPPLARGVVRYAGEPVAIVVATSEAAALKGVRMLKPEYEILESILSPREAAGEGAALIHPELTSYKKVQKDIRPIERSNIAAKFQIRKGDTEKAFRESAVIAEQTYHLPPSDHIAMEVRTARVEKSADGKVKVETSSQAPYEVVKQLSSYFNIPAGDIEVHVPMVGGGFGGKAPVTLELLAYMACEKVNGSPVRLIITREEDMETAPCRLGMDAQIKLGAGSDGKINAASFTFYVDTGAYTDIGPYMAKSIAADCTGPYNIENLSCDSLCVYTNHSYSTSYRGFGHLCYTFCVERTIDMLAEKCGLDPVEIRLRNAIRPGDLTPTQVVSTLSNTGDVTACLEKLKEIIKWDGNPLKEQDNDTVKAIGVSCIWKAANPPTNAVSGAVITFNPDGSLNLNTGVVEMGSGGQTNLAQILAEKLKMDINKVHVSLEVNTRLNPQHYKTVASMTNFMAGNAVMRAAEDVLGQLKDMGAQIFSCTPEEIVVENSRVYPEGKPDEFIDFKDIVMGYQTKNGASLGEPVIAKGPYMLKGLSMLDPNTGKGRTGPAWTVGAQAAEVEYNRRDRTYRLLRAVTVMDVGQVINPRGMKEMVCGGMAMGAGMATREGLWFCKSGGLSTPNLRTYKLLHIGQEPVYHAEFIETPQMDAPYGTRSMSEHGIIGIPAALANALSAAAEITVDTLPLTPEYLWRKKEGSDDCR